MSSISVKTLLFVSSADKAYSRSFLFHCAKYWADKGNKVVYITHEPLNSLPYSIGIPRSGDCNENFHLVQFLYLPTWKDLLKHCYSVLLQPKPALVLIIQEIETYFSDSFDNDRVSLVCASVLQAASVSASKNSKPAYVICGYNSRNSTIPGNVVRNFFRNVWEIVLCSEKSEDKDCDRHLKLVRLSQRLEPDQVKVFVFKENRERSFLEFESALRVVMNEL